jgi:hypothetical protein
MPIVEEGMLNLPQKRGVGQGEELLVNYGMKVTKAESGDGAKTSFPRMYCGGFLS